MTAIWRRLHFPAVAVLSLLFVAFLLAGSRPAQAFCFCPKCLLGVYESYQPVAGSMKPAIEPGACVTVLKRAAVDRGSIIVFRHPVTPDTVYIKRLIGLPGDTVELRDGWLILNGVEVPQSEAEPYVQQMTREGPNRSLPYCPPSTAIGGFCKIERRHESLGSEASWDILNAIVGGPSDDFGPATVPQGHFFVLGDHRDNSFDSRFSQEIGGMGSIPLENLVGRVVEIENP